jgi:hypothetical protein
LHCRWDSTILRSKEVIELGPREVELFTRASARRARLGGGRFGGEQEEETYFFEVHHDGHVEIRFFNPHGLIREFRPGQIPAGTLAIIDHFLAKSIVEIVRRARRIFDVSGIYEEYVVSLVLGKSRGTVLIRPTVTFYQDKVVGEDLGVRWEDDVLKIQEPGFTNDPYDVPAKRLCDHLWQTYGRWDCPLFDAEGPIRIWMTVTLKEKPHAQS